MIQCGIPVRTMLYSVTDRLDFWLSSSVLVYRSWMLALRGLNVHTAGYWIQDTSSWVQVTSSWMQDTSGWIQDTSRLDTGYIKAGYRIHQSRIRDTSSRIHRDCMDDTSKLDTVHQAGYMIHRDGYMIHRDWMNDTSKLDTAHQAGYMIHRAG